MKTYPIIFSGPMVRALLEGRKTQTRRLITSMWSNLKMHQENGDQILLYVRETFVSEVEYDATGDLIPKIWYRASAPELRWIDDDNWIEIPWKPAIHMSRSASRPTLEVTDARLERLQDISAREAIKEGMTFPEGMEWGSGPKEAFMDR
jgi:hypothetical protein